MNNPIRMFIGAILAMVSPDFLTWLFWVSLTLIIDNENNDRPKGKTQNFLNWRTCSLRGASP